MTDLERLNAITTMVIDKYRKREHRLKIVIFGIVIIYLLTVWGLFQYFSPRIDKNDLAFAVTAPLSLTVFNANAMPKPCRRC